MKEYVLSAFVYTEKILFVHPDYYSILTEKEKRAVITRVAVMIESQYLKQNALVLGSIPIMTHIASLGYEKLFDWINPKIASYTGEGSCTHRLCTYHMNATTSWIGKMAVNIILSSLYLKNESLKTDLKTVQRTGNPHALLSYYGKIQEKKETDAFLLSIVKQPSYKMLKQALMRYNTP
jgi:hypothetical protein